MKMRQTSDRAGRYTEQATGYRAFAPKPLPPEPPVSVDNEMLELLSRADRALGRLDGSTGALPNPDLFTFMYIRREAVLSSQIEGTQASLSDVLEVEAKIHDANRPTDAFEVVNYIKALYYGLERLATLPLSLRLIREIHERLLEGARGQEKSPGEFRRSQNWIGPEGGTLAAARYVPPALDDMHQALNDLEAFLYDESPMPLLIRIGLAHAQFETIHPFLDGNGRVGRLLITFLLCQRNVLHQPLLYLSYYFKQNRTEYYDRLQAVRDNGDWEAWLKFFLRGVAEVANEATDVAKQIIALREEDRAVILGKGGRSSGDLLRIHEQLFKNPFASIPLVESNTGVSYPTAARHVASLESLGILQEMTGRTYGKTYRYGRYFRLFADEEPATG